MRPNFADKANHIVDANKKVGIGTRMSKAITKATGKQPCGTCRQIRDGIDRVEQVIRKTF